MTELEFDIVDPDPSALIESLRSFGYSVETSVADLIDNSITAGATTIYVRFEWGADDSWIAISDDGAGIEPDQLSNVMRPGSRNPLADRGSDDLGRFGLGLKTASFSQARSLTVASRTVACKQPTCRRWDLDHVGKTGQWQLLKAARAGSGDRLDFIGDGPGTVVLWEHIDRIVPPGSIDTDRRHFFETATRVERHLAAVFHRFIERKQDRIQIFVNGNGVEPWNPFLPDQSSWLPLETLPAPDRRTVKVQPYILPHHSRFASKSAHELAGGIKGWNAQQGFYVYRADRLILSGGWLSTGFKPEEHFKLARIAVDIDQSMDAAWDIDVRKSRTRPPSGLKDDLVRIARRTRKSASEVYRHRGQRISKLAGTDKQIPVWRARRQNDEFVYSINRTHALVLNAIDESQDRAIAVRALIELVERTLPVAQVVFDHSVDPDAQVSPDSRAVGSELIASARATYLTLVAGGTDPQLAKRLILELEPFYNHPDIVETLSE